MEATPDLFIILALFTTTEKINKNDFLFLAPRSDLAIPLSNAYSPQYPAFKDQTTNVKCYTDTPKDTYFALNSAFCLLND